MKASRKHMRRIRGKRMDSNEIQMNLATTKKIVSSISYLTIKMCQTIR